MPNHNPHFIPLQHIAFDELNFDITVAEESLQIPFSIRRVYWLRSGTNVVRRGNHAHMNSHQFIVAIAGDIRVHITSQTQEKTSFGLKAAGVGLYIPPRHWLSLEMPEQSMLLCFSSHTFEDQETVYDFEDFLRSV